MVLAVGLILTVAGLMGVAYAVFRSSGVQKTIDLLEIENKALSSSVNRQSNDMTALQERVHTLEGENKVLRNVVTGRQAIEELTAWAKEQGQQRKGEHESLMRELAEVKEQVEEMWRGLTRMLGK